MTDRELTEQTEKEALERVLARIARWPDAPEPAASSATRGELVLICAVAKRAQVLIPCECGCGRATVFPAKLAAFCERQAAEAAYSIERDRLKKVLDRVLDLHKDAIDALTKIHKDS